MAGPTRRLTCRGGTQVHSLKTSLMACSAALSDLTAASESQHVCIHPFAMCLRKNTVHA